MKKTFLALAALVFLCCDIIIYDDRGSVEINSTPEAEVWIHKSFIGITPCTLRTDYGKKKITLITPDSVVYDTTLFVPCNNKSAPAINVVYTHGDLILKTEAGKTYYNVRMYIDDDRYPSAHASTIDSSGYRFDRISVGSHMLKIRSRDPYDYKEYYTEKYITIEPGKNLEIVINLQPTSTVSHRKGGS